MLKERNLTVDSRYMLDCKFILPKNSFVFEEHSLPACILDCHFLVLSRLLSTGSELVFRTS